MEIVMIEAVVKALRKEIATLMERTFGSYEKKEFKRTIVDQYMTKKFEEEPLGQVW